MSSFWLLIRRLLFRERHQRIQESLERSYSLHWTSGGLDDEECEFEDRAEYCDDQLQSETLPDHLVPSFAREDKQSGSKGTKFPRNFVLDWEAGGAFLRSNLVILKQLLSDRCLCQDLSVSDMEEVEEEQRRSKVEETVEIEHNIVTCSECRELSLTAF